MPINTTTEPTVEPVSEQITDYLSPFTLWLCVRGPQRADGTSSVELAWPDDDPEGGPLMFVSRLHAELYATLRNREHDREDSEDGEAADIWQCVPLQSFPLREYIRTLGGTINCELAYGFMSDETGALVIADGAPRARFLELSFDVGDEIDDPMFGFNLWAFEFMRDEWASIGAAQVFKTFDRIDEMAHAPFARVLDAALARTTITHDEPEVDHWSVYDPSAGRWIGALANVRLDSLTLH